MAWKNDVYMTSHLGGKIWRFRWCPNDEYEVELPLLKDEDWK